MWKLVMVHVNAKYQIQAICSTQRKENESICVLCQRA